MVSIQDCHSCDSGSNKIPFFEKKGLLTPKKLKNGGMKIPAGALFFLKDE